MVDAAPTTMGGDRESHIPDQVLMYACIFSYEKPKYRTQILNFKFDQSGKY